MNFKYEDYIKRQLNICKYDLEYDDLEIEIATEQLFEKDENLIPNSIYVVIKYLSSDITYESFTLPVQILVLCEENNLERTQILLNKFAKENNWGVIHEGSEFIKQQYSTPVVLNNFNEISYGWRSVMYLTGTLFVMENVLDFKDITINTIPVTPTSFSYSYNMSGDTQPSSESLISITKKSVSTVTISMSLPLVNTQNVLNDIISVSTGNTTGNTDFTISFKLNEITYSFVTKLVSAVYTTMPNNIPGLQLGFMV